ncbi:MYPT2 phosphatase, partial [Pterocles burchelli]|nr:MYPT2 phosphatase [Pterocles burchelli]
ERKQEPFANHSSHETRPSITEQIPPPEPNSFTASARRFSWLSKSEEQKDESPASWRLGLRKTGSHNMLSEVAATREAQRDKTSSIYRSSSSPRISALLDNKDKDKDNKSYLATIAPRRLSSTSDIEEKENRESAVNLVRSGSYTRQPWRDDSKGNEAPHSGAPTTYVSTYLKRAPFRQQTDSTVEKNTEGISASTPLGVITNRAVLGSANGIANAGAASTPGKDGSAEEARERRRSYLTPVRDEEAESLRKARSRQARQTRRSTQVKNGNTHLRYEIDGKKQYRGVMVQLSHRQEGGGGGGGRGQLFLRSPLGISLFCLLSDSKTTVYRRLRCPVQPDKPTTPVSPSTSAPLLYTSSYLTRTNKYLGLDSVNPADFRGSATEMEKNECEDQDLDDRSPNKQSIRERRRPKERRRGTGIIFSTKDDDDEVDGNEEVKETRVSENLCLNNWLEAATNPPASDSSYGDRASSRSSAYARRENRLAALSSRAEEESNRDYKKLYETALSENQKLKSKLQEAQLELADIKSKLEKAAQQKQEKTSDRSSMLEMEKREKRALERKLSEMEEEMKILTELKSDNQRLKDENGALIRVISKLSK